MALTDNLVSYWKFEGNSNDSVGSNNGTDVNITYSTGNGKIGQGAGFNANNNSKITCSGRIPQGAKSLSFWFKTTATNFYQLISECYNGSNSYGIGLDPGGAEINRASSSKVLSISGGTNLNDGNWHHQVFTWDGTTNTNGVKLYIDNVLVAQSTAAYTETTQSSYTTHFGYYDNNYDYTGSLDELGVWSRVLTSDEVSTLYNSGNGLQYPFTTTSSFFQLF
jgi:hypothetical protein